ncbi:MAG TPA: phosphoribosyl-AMP cyclohydrolase [Chromatiales bacterium]|nr:phosphoribosyl-AMP cyclohydrolase [Chromatiales bacterium]
MSDWLDEVKWTRDGLVPAIAQDAADNSVLMVAWMNREALALTVETGHAVYWSRSRQKLWHKGEASGHQQNIKEIRLDCDNDVILLKVEQLGGIACHTGRHDCFFKVYRDGEWVEVAAVLKPPEEIYGE